MIFNKSKIILPFLLIPSFANSALHDRGNGMIYDDVLDITWLQDANYAYTSGYTVSNATDLNPPNNVDPDYMDYSPDVIMAGGTMANNAAKTWVSNLVYEGFNDWRLPSARLPSNPVYGHSYDGSTVTGYNITSSELGHMFYNNLGNAGGFDTAGNALNNPVSGLNYTYSDANGSFTFSNVKPDHYWYDETGYGAAMTMNMAAGSQSSGAHLWYRHYAWAVRDGDVLPPTPIGPVPVNPHPFIPPGDGPLKPIDGVCVPNASVKCTPSEVPLPAAFWLLGSAIGGLFYYKRK